MMWLVALWIVQSVPPPGKQVDLSGHWVIDSKFDVRGASEADPEICARDCVMTQDKQTLTVKVGAKTTTYRLDGVPTTKTFQVAEYAPEIKTTARWDADVLVVVVVIKVDDSVRENRSRISLHNGRLSIDTTSTSKPSKHIEYTRSK